MRTLKTVKPGQKGTKDLLARYGPSLLCVRYRYDENLRERLKTVELAVERCSQKRKAGLRRSEKLDAATHRSVALRIGWREKDVQQRIKSAGGRWDPDRKIWRLRRDAVERLGLLHRIVGGGS